jgi:hypothetical protein
LQRFQRVIGAKIFVTQPVEKSAEGGERPGERGVDEALALAPRKKGSEIGGRERAECREARRLAQMLAQKAEKARDIAPVSLARARRKPARRGEVREPGNQGLMGELGTRGGQVRVLSNQDLSLRGRASWFETAASRPPHHEHSSS